jgi:hypothetical protein
MSIPIENAAGSIDWPAWVQAVGSIIAILAAIWIDNGAARRSKKAFERAILRDQINEAQRLSQWEEALKDAVESIEKVVELVTSPGRFNQLIDHTPYDWQSILRALQNSKGTIEIYLREEPPSARIGRALVAVQTELVLPISVARDAGLGTYPMGDFRRMVSEHAELITRIGEAYFAGHTPFVSDRPERV